MIVTREKIFLYPKLNEIEDIINNTILQHRKNMAIIIVEKSNSNITFNFLII